MSTKQSLSMRIFCAAFLSLIFAGPVFAAELQLEISGFEATTGQLFVAAYDNKKDWLGDRSVANESVVVADSIHEGVVQISLQLEAGEYAISLYHDVNDNGKMDTRQLIPIPKEPVGISNNIKPRFGPPKFKHAKFQLQDEVLRLQIELQ